ncbi:glycosyltransferase, partial [Paenibacillus sp. AR247]|uniref:glycosyltransferase n=1 Tax=Paenibacillus sp. AR247 TaxID=1631599 RepID=UPI000D434936
MQQWKSLLSEAHVGTIRWNEPLESYTTWKIGGPADALVIPGSVEQLVSLISLLHANQIPWLQIGRGSNLLVADKGFRGVVIKLGGELDHAHFQGNRVTAGGGFSLVKLSVLALKEFKPDVVIGTGGYVCGPVVYAAAKLGIPSIIHEQNAIPGLTNQFLSRYVST